MQDLYVALENIVYTMVLYGDLCMAVNRVCQGYTMGMNFLNRTLTCEHHTRGRYRYIPTRKIGGVQQNPWYNLYPWLF